MLLPLLRTIKDSVKRKGIWICLVAIIHSTLVLAQGDTLRFESVADFLRKGSVGGSSRTYFMATDNQGLLTDYYALATAAGMRYQTPNYKGFSAGISGYFITNIASSDFTKLDPATQNPSRYELGLFDVTNPADKHELTRLEELWIRFERKKSSVRFGKYLPENIFINGQDGRMRPTLVQGLQLKTAFGKNEVEVQVINKVAPRSTVKWYSVEETFGIYPEGRNPDGTPSSYFQKTQTPGILIAELTNASVKNTTVLLGSISVPNVFQTYYLNSEFVYKKVFAGLMIVGQHPLGNGGNDLVANKYANEADKSLIISGQIGKKIKKHSIGLNFTTIRSSGRFLMPREWGRESFYTFMPRERNEGAGDVNAISANVKMVVNPQFKVLAAYGKFFLPDAANAAQNKYALPSYNQFNLLLNCSLKNIFKGLSVRGLYVRKDLMDKQIENPRLIFNKGNMHLYHLILDFTF
jgi:hypothetical protein